MPRDALAARRSCLIPDRLLVGGKHPLQPKGLTISCKNMLPSCFGGGHHFAGDRQSRMKTAEYLQCHLRKGNAWLEVQQEIREYLHSRENTSQTNCDGNSHCQKTA